MTTAAPTTAPPTTLAPTTAAPCFSASWGCSCALVIQASKVDGNLTNFPVLLTKDTLPSKMFDADGSHPALSGGGDIRFSSDSDGCTRLSCEIVTFTIDNDPANGVAEIWVKVPSVSSSSNTTFYVWWNKLGESQPAVDAAYGAESVWDSNFKMVQHMEDATTSTITDSTSNDNDGTKKAANEPIEATGKIGKGQDFDSVDDVINGAITGLTNYVATVTAWIYPHTEGENNGGRVSILQPSSGWNVLFFDPSGINRLKVGINDGVNGITRVGTDNDIALNTWNHVAYSYSGGAGGSNIKIYVNGAEVSYSSTTGANAVSAAPANFCIGADDSGGASVFDGIIDAVKFSNVVRTLNWIKAEYNNQNDPSTFVIEGAPGCTTPTPTTLASTTLPPTTLAPTTLPPTTLPPTTLAPTTLPPTTLAPTTIAPTTLAPTSLAPTTLAPTTEAPTTPTYTTVGPTTVHVATTPIPTTTAPTSLLPTTVAPTTLPPTSLVPTTLAPTTLAPTTIAVTTQVPPTTLFQTTAGPTTKAPTTAEPTTPTPTTSAPTTTLPTTLAPTTVVPTTLQSTTLAPTTVASTTTEPTTLAPTTQIPTTLALTTLAPTTLGPTVPPTTNIPEVICMKEFNSTITNEIPLKSLITKEIRSDGHLC